MIKSSERSRPSPLLWLASVWFLLFVLLPVAGLLFNTAPQDWGACWQQPFVRQALSLSLFTSVIATVLAVLVGTPVAYLLARYRFRGKEFVDTLVDLPMTLPPVAAGVGLLMAFGRCGLLGPLLKQVGICLGFSTAAVVIAQVFVSAPFFIKAARSGLESVNPTLEQASWTLGVSRWRTFYQITLPLARPAFIAGIMLTWARALSEFGATMMFAGNLEGRTRTMPLAIMTAMEVDLNSAIVLSLLLIVFCFAIFTLTRWVLRITGP